MVPIPRASSWEELNLHLETDYRKRCERRRRWHTETIGERFERDHAALLRCPRCRSLREISAQVSSPSLVRYRLNDYSVPIDYGHRQVWVKGYVYEVVVTCGSEVIAQHERSYDRETVVFDPLCYLALLEQKTRTLDQAAPLHPTDKKLSVGIRFWPVGSCRSASRSCDDCSKCVRRSMEAESMCRCCVCSRSLTLQR